MARLYTCVVLEKRETCTFETVFASSAFSLMKRVRFLSCVPELRLPVTGERFVRVAENSGSLYRFDATLTRSIAEPIPRTFVTGFKHHPRSSHGSSNRSERMYRRFFVHVDSRRW